MFQWKRCCSLDVQKVISVHLSSSWIEVGSTTTQSGLVRLPTDMYVIYFWKGKRLPKCYISVVSFINILEIWFVSTYGQILSLIQIKYFQNTCAHDQFYYDDWFCHRLMVSTSFRIEPMNKHCKPSTTYLFEKIFFVYFGYLFSCFIIQ